MQGILVLLAVALQLPGLLGAPIRCKAGRARTGPLHERFSCKERCVDELLHGYTSEEPGPVNGKHKIMSKLRGNRSSFIETGTYLGATLNAVLSSNDFEELFSVEYSKRLHTRAIQKFQQNANVHLYLGSSDKKITEMIADSAATPHGSSGAVFWLDAHYSAGITAGGNQPESPVLHEVRAVLDDARVRPHVMIIDDLRVWTGHVKPINGQLYPLPSELHAAVCAIAPDARFRVAEDAMAVWPRFV